MKKNLKSIFKSFKVFTTAEEKEILKRQKYAKIANEQIDKNEKQKEDLKKEVLLKILAKAQELNTKIDTEENIELKEENTNGENAETNRII